MKRRMTAQTSNLICAFVGIAVGAVAIGITTGFKQFVNVPVGPEVFPRIMAAGLILCSIALIIFNLVKKDTEKAPPLSLRDHGIRRMLIIAGIVLVYYLLLETVGYLILSPLLLFFSMFVMDYRNYRNMAIISVSVTAAVFLLFWQVLVIELPLGFLESLF